MAAKKTSNPKADDVDGFLAALAHPRKAEVEALRKAILASDKGITERVKWNAPSFCIDGDDRITFRLQPGDRVELIFHRGAKVKKDAFSFEDETGLLQMVAPDRGIVVFGNAADVKAKTPKLKKLVKAWMGATRGAE